MLSKWAVRKEFNDQRDRKFLEKVVLYLWKEERENMWPHTYIF